MAPTPLRSLRIVAAALAFASVTAYAQTLSPAVEVQRLAPQLVQFAGSLANFQSLANGLALGLPVTLTSVTPDGFLQTVTFTPATTQAPVDVARSLERARQGLIARGIAAPTGQQIGVALLGGQLQTASGVAPVAGVLPGAATALSASTGASSAAAVPMTVELRAVAPAATTGVTVPAATVLAPPVRNTSDSPILRNTSDSALPASGVTGTSTAAPNGAPSPAAQLQGRR